MHGHFQRLKTRFPRVADHFLGHECVLRGAVITSWAPEVQARRTHLWFVVEEKVGPANSGGNYCFKGSSTIGWWNNSWQHWEEGENSKMIGLLTGQKHIANPAAISLSSCEAFIRWLNTLTWRENSAGFGPRVISQQLVCLAALYNQGRWSGE